MKRFSKTSVASLVMILAAVGSIELAMAQRSGQSITVQYGVVSGAREVDLNSNAVPTGAVVGGTIGLISGSGKRSSKKVRNTVIGTAAGATVGSAARGPTRGLLYTVQMGSLGMVQVVSDQREIRIGDCVAVERVRDTANIRRVSTAYCNVENKEAVAAIEKSAHAEAEECQQAKRQLVEAETAEAADLATLKMRMLCAD